LWTRNRPSNPSVTRASSREWSIGTGSKHSFAVPLERGCSSRPTPPTHSCCQLITTCFEMRYRMPRSGNQSNITLWIRCLASASRHVRCVPHVFFILSRKSSPKVLYPRIREGLSLGHHINVRLQNYHPLTGIRSLKSNVIGEILYMLLCCILVFFHTVKNREARELAWGLAASPGAGRARPLAPLARAGDKTCML
jgi:hypothetical protein